MRTDRAPALLFIAVFLALLAVLVARSAADPDLWGHVRFGQDILASGSVVRLDPYSFTSDRTWVNHEWLAEVVMAITFRFGGAAGLLLLSSGAAFVSVSAAWRHLRRNGVGEPVAVALATVLFAGVASQLSAVRPQLFSVVLLVALSITLRSAERGSAARLLWVLPLFAAWANLHGGWIVGLGVVGLWAFPAAVRGLISWRWAVLAPIAAVVGSSFNPYGWRLWQFLWDTVGLGRADVQDWQPIHEHPTHLIPWTLTAVMAFLGWRRRRGKAAHLVVPVVVLGLLALRVVRLDVSFVVAAVVLLGPLYAGLGPDRFALSRQPARGELLAVGLLVALGLSVAVSFAWGTAACLPVEGKEPIMPETEAVVFAQQNHLVGKMVSWFDYGQYAIWHLAPDVKVSYDGRRETVYSEKTREAHIRFYRGGAPGYAGTLGADYVWLPNGLPAVPALLRDGWIPIFAGTRSTILTRHAGRSFVSAGSRPNARCFPGP